MDWNVAFRTAVIGALIVGVGFLAVGAFYRVWYAAGVLAAVALVGLVLYLVNAWSKWQAGRERKRWKRSSPD